MNSLTVHELSDSACAGGLNRVIAAGSEYFQSDFSLQEKVNNHCQLASKSSGSHWLHPGAFLIQGISRKSGTTISFPEHGFSMEQEDRIPGAIETEHFPVSLERVARAAGTFRKSGTGVDAVAEWALATILATVLATNY